MQEKNIKNGKRQRYNLIIKMEKKKLLTRTTKTNFTLCVLILYKFYQFYSTFSF